ncbi:MAG: endonuclease III [Deltaproteobacteria bacterium]|nr:endonuclease III [Deltaproteobacteria bacterium]
MNKTERVQFICETLDTLYPNPPIPLEHNNVFSLLIATVLSAQCTDKRVNVITPVLFKKYRDVHEFAKADVEEVKDIIKSCGLSGSKSKAIVALSKSIVEKFNGEVPGNFKELETLSGVGHKTASVVMSQGFNVQAFPVDTHIHRLAKRWKLSNGKSVEQTEEDLKKVFKKETWNLRHLQIIYFGREYCPARGHDIKTCPICNKI